MLNVNKLKHFFPGEEKEDDTDAQNDTQHAEEIIKFDHTMPCPLTRAWSKLIKNNTTISTLVNKSEAATSEEIWYKLNSIAYKLYHLNLDFNQLTSEELKFWRTFKKEDIFEWLSGSPIHHQITPNTFVFALRSTILQSANNNNNHRCNLYHQINNWLPQLKTRYLNLVHANQADLQGLKTNQRIL